LGDAGTVSVIGKGAQYGESFFSMCTEGDNIETVIVKAGGARIPSSPETLKMQEWEDGSVRNLEQIIMVGDDVFSFAISVLPRDIKRLLEVKTLTRWIFVLSIRLTTLCQTMWPRKPRLTPTRYYIPSKNTVTLLGLLSRSVW
jgi:hypothetical protein